MIETHSSAYPIWIKITSIPRGEAPEEIRKEWVGLEFPATEPYMAEDAVGVVTLDRDLDRIVYAVNAKLAVLYLIAQGKEEAAAWWHDNLIIYPVAEDLCFGTDEAEPSEGLMDCRVELNTERFWKVVMTEI
jgi:hypothetical protein